MAIPRKPIQPIIILIVMSLVVIQIVFLNPAPLEKDPRELEAPGLDPKQVIKSLTQERPMAPGIPTDKIPEYTIKKLGYTSSIGTAREWKIDAESANLFRPEKLVHSYKVLAYLYSGEDEDEEPTLVVGDEAKYFTHKRDLEVFGNVITTFPDGFTLYSDYMLYQPHKKNIHIPKSYRVRGKGPVDDQKNIEFTSNGMDSNYTDKMVHLREDVLFTMIRQGPRKPFSKGVPEKTTIKSDFSRIDRNEQIAHFTMDQKRPLKERFVRINQPDTFVKGRRVRLNYGDFTEVFKYLIAYEDVFIREMNEDELLRYGTCGQADFDTKDNIVILTKYPQVYQDNDTVTGDLIKILRDKDLVEIVKSNAYSEGNE